MIDPVVRLGEPGDAATVEHLETDARRGLADARGGPRWLDEHRLIGSRWPDVLSTRTVFVAVIPVDDPPAEALVGYLVVDLVDVGGPPTEPTVLVAHVDQVFVLDEARELGFGDALLAAAMEWGRTSGATLVEAHALPGDRQLKNLYERAGVTARLITVSRAL